MASFVEELWNSIFTPGATPTLLIATNASFAALQLLFLVMLIATYSVHFLVLSVICAGLWASINWFVVELQAVKAKEEEEAKRQQKNKSPEPEKSPSGGSDTETESAPPPKRPVGLKDSSGFLKARPADASQALRQRHSQGDSSGYVSTDSEWEKVSEGDDREQ